MDEKITRKNDCNLQDAVSAAFNAANQYADTFEPYREFYRENELSDMEAVRQQEHGKWKKIATELSLKSNSRKWKAIKSEY